MQKARIIDDRDLSDRQISLESTGGTDTVRNMRRGSNPRADTLDALCEALNLRVDISPRQDFSSVDVARPEVVSMNAPVGRCVHSEQSSIKTAIVDDGELAEIIAILVDSWESGTERDRGGIRDRFKVAFREERERAASAPGPRLAGLVAIKGADEWATNP